MYICAYTYTFTPYHLPQTIILTVPSRWSAPIFSYIFANACTFSFRGPPDCIHYNHPYVTIVMADHTTLLFHFVSLFIIYQWSSADYDHFTTPSLLQTMCF